MAKESSMSKKISLLYMNIYGRQPTASDLKIGKAYLASEEISSSKKGDKYKKSNQEEGWQNYIVALINSPEFYFVQ